ncbi:hypothetical protein Tco_0986923, partial [Tanacetum coccineum]
VAVSDVPGDGSRVHKHDHDGSEAPDESPDSILSSEPKPLRKHRSPPLPSILSPGESSYPLSVNRPATSPYRLIMIYETYYPEHPLVKHTNPVYHAHGTSPTIIGAISRIASAGSTQVSLIPVDKYNLLRGGCSDSGISSVRSIGGGMYRDAGSGGSGGDDDGSNGDGIGSGDECEGGVVHLARRSPAEGGDSEIGGDGNRVVMARSLSTSAYGGRDIEV